MKLSEDYINEALQQHTVIPPASSSEPEVIQEAEIINDESILQQAHKNRGTSSEPKIVRTHTVTKEDINKAKRGK